MKIGTFKFRYNTIIDGEKIQFHICEKHRIVAQRDGDFYFKIDGVIYNNNYYGMSSSILEQAFEKYEDHLKYYWDIDISKLGLK